MNQPPTPQSIAATTQVLELASLLDNRIAAPDKARIMAWAKQIDRHPRLERDDMLNAVQDFYDRPSPQPVSVGDIIDGARRIKRDRLDREDDQAREQRQNARDPNAADDMRGLFAGAVLGPVGNRTPRLVAAENALQCCHDKHTAMQAIREFFAAKREAQDKPPLVQGESA